MQGCTPPVLHLSCATPSCAAPVRCCPVLRCTSPVPHIGLNKTCHAAMLPLLVTSKDSCRMFMTTAAYPISTPTTTHIAAITGRETANNQEAESTGDASVPQESQPDPAKHSYTSRARSTGSPWPRPPTRPGPCTWAAARTAGSPPLGGGRSGLRTASPGEAERKHRHGG